MRVKVLEEGGEEGVGGGGRLRVLLLHGCRRLLGGQGAAGNGPQVRVKLFLMLSFT